MLRTGAATRRRPTGRRGELFDELVALFLREGFREFTVDALAARLRCSKTTPVSYTHLTLPTNREV